MFPVWGGTTFQTFVPKIPIDFPTFRTFIVYVNEVVPVEMIGRLVTVLSQWL